jgi:methyl-accepting chemotaxis protein
MTKRSDTGTASHIADSLAASVKSRVRYLILAGMIVVALVFGASFYFALIANQSALARQVPELEAVAAKLKSLLIMNTLVFIAIIIASFYALSNIIAARMFQPLATLHRSLLTIAEGKLPRSFEAGERGPFSALDDALKTAVSCLCDRERKEIEEISRLAEALEQSPASRKTAHELKEIVARKSACLGASEIRTEAKGKEANEDPLFIQPA